MTTVTPWWLSTENGRFLLFSSEVLLCDYVIRFRKSNALNERSIYVK